MWVWLAVTRCLAPVTFSRYLTACVIRRLFKFRFISIAVGYYRLLSTRVWLTHSATPVIFPWYATSSFFGPFFLFRANQAVILFIVALRSGCAMLYCIIYSVLSPSARTSWETTFFFLVLYARISAVSSASCYTWWRTQYIITETRAWQYWLPWQLECDDLNHSVAQKRSIRLVVRHCPLPRVYMNWRYFFCQRLLCWELKFSSSLLQLIRYPGQCVHWM